MEAKIGNPRVMALRAEATAAYGARRAGGVLQWAVKGSDAEPIPLRARKLVQLDSAIGHR